MVLSISFVIAAGVRLLLLRRRSARADGKQLQSEGYCAYFREAARKCHSLDFMYRQKLQFDRIAASITETCSGCDFEACADNNTSSSSRNYTNSNVAIPSQFRQPINHC